MFLKDQAETDDGGIDSYNTTAKRIIDQMVLDGYIRILPDLNQKEMTEHMLSMKKVLRIKEIKS